MTSLFSLLIRTRDDGECMVWTGARNHDGYPLARIGKSVRKVHRLVAELTHGGTAGKCVCHSCDNRSCIAPGHLFVGTNAENVADKVRKARQARVHGPRKLTMADASAVRACRALGSTVASLAKEFDVSVRQIQRILSGARWGHAANEVAV